MYLYWSLFFVLLLVLEYFSLVYFLKIMARKFNLIDKPNHRSSHTLPPPRGAGAIFLSFILLAISSFLPVDSFDYGNLKTLLIGSLGFGLIGFTDDLKRLSALQRLVPQIVISIWVLLDVTEYLRLPFEVQFLPIASPTLAFVFGILFIIWLVNLFNFMDGLDGFLGSQSILIGFLSFILCYLQGEALFGCLYLIISITLLPFLYLNWRPAQVFMGDSGSYFLGFIFAFLAIYSKVVLEMNFIALVILMGALICDSTTTLLIRAYRTKQPLKAHKTHGYQVLKHVYSKPVPYINGIYGALTCFWFFGFAMLAVLYPVFSVYFCVSSYVPFVVALLKLKVGIQNKKSQGY